ncbi:unnamed protein product, partial [Litomosoides sigmodontis]
IKGVHLTQRIIDVLLEVADEAREDAHFYVAYGVVNFELKFPPNVHVSSPTSSWWASLERPIMWHKTFCLFSIFLTFNAYCQNLKCKPGYHYNKVTDACYKVYVTTATNFTEVVHAASLCELENAMIASITSRAEANYLYDLAPQWSNTRRKQEYLTKIRGTHTWKDETINEYQNWSTTEELSYTCVEINPTTGYWKKIPCGNHESDHNVVIICHVRPTVLRKQKYGVNALRKKRSVTHQPSERPQFEKLPYQSTPDLSFGTSAPMPSEIITKAAVEFETPSYPLTSDLLIATSVPMENEVTTKLDFEFETSPYPPTPT